MNTYKYTVDQETQAYDPTTLKEYLDENVILPCYPSIAGPTISIQTEADKATLDIVMAAYLAQDNKLLAAQAEMWGAIKAERDRRSSTGFLEPVSDKWFHSDDKSRTQQLGMVIMGAGLPIDINWKTMDGSFIQLTPAIVGNIFAAIAASDQAIFAAAETHKAAMLLEADPTTYNYSGGWPLAFGE